MTVHSILPTDHVEVLIVGAGISGIGMARYLSDAHPGKHYQILETRSELGGTWSLFRYPGIRSDSDLYTFGYAFKPWTNEKSIADAASILEYLREAAREGDVERHIRYGQRVISANWRSAEAQWEVIVEAVATGARRTMTCRWFFCAGGYYRYEEGFTPRFEGLERFKGQVIHPQHWPEDLDYSGKNVVVIGSGATAMTLIPAIAPKAAHVTMLQRTPTYVLSLPSRDTLGNALHRILPSELAHALIRRKNISLSRAIWRFCKRYPQAARKLIRYANRKSLPEGYPVDEHFNPPYNPWDQRVCAVPDGDMFRALRKGKASVVTDHIDTFTETGIRLKSGRELNADIVVTATGLNVQLFGGISLAKDGEPIDLSKAVAYKGLMLSGIPNFAFAIGYTNASWTLKVGLVCEHFCRLLTYMDKNGYASCQPVAPEGLPTRPLLDFGAGYVQRALDKLPRQGPGAPWVMSMDYFQDVKLLRKGAVADKALAFAPAPVSASQGASPVRRVAGGAK
ncbi:flavin-containing monooxygenase [Paraburkholderia megapolitana]|uniref:Predicted flavoprotein CzcO associated with the cation diffusion facilitator CzcD n=1 Tax=Paraburkholderia megapolitana TaxID=420953 RepID=A0A1I3QAL2_9BURK|nr:NAD(P)/FAD-dependent oxidoreductase [Paraburkholderia megapolitana]QDQ81161.1 NAD(P)/FAD-dependent oxidoreductase [Paraburkholderia megapolitana]SFJ30592.1 Predicted flavoprotein CzcO associated with the cation diffusion facilitator CzcD [Paraburkholderia megapolitana]